LEENIRDAYQLMMVDTETMSRPGIKSKEISVEVARKGSSLFANSSGLDAISNGMAADTTSTPTVARANKPVPRHTEVKESLCELIRNQLGLTK